ncbi:MAG: hypothetical protein M1834_006951 [Cirrosporium novae-zelandiae]|nr:MAG: hypothetical protein M1834_006951 [Cirrosporium novae-zelandiae]
MAFISFSGNQYNVVSEKAKAASFDEIPLIDLSLPKDEIVKRVRDACTRVGFMYIQNHNVPQEVIDSVFKSGKEFFSLGRKAKEAVHFKNVKSFKGYESMGGVYTDETKKPDLNEAFSWGYAEEMDFLHPSPASSPSTTKHSDLEFMHGANQWPSSLPGLKPDVSTYFSHILILARRLIRLFALALNLPETYFDSMMARPGTMGKMLHYPTQSPTSQVAEALGIGAHTDIECFTILCQDNSVPGLQVLNQKGEWILAPPKPGTFVINIGDMLARWSNDTFLSTVHRVLNITGQERYSLPVFMGPSYETILKPLETCVSEERPARYEPISAGLYVWKRLAVSRLNKEEFEKQLAQFEEAKVDVHVHGADVVEVVG